MARNAVTDVFLEKTGDTKNVPLHARFGHAVLFVADYGRLLFGILKTLRRRGLRCSGTTVLPSSKTLNGVEWHFNLFDVPLYDRLRAYSALRTVISILKTLRRRRLRCSGTEVGHPSTSSPRGNGNTLPDVTRPVPRLLWHRRSRESSKAQTCRW